MLEGIYATPLAYFGEVPADPERPAESAHVSEVARVMASIFRLPPQIAWATTMLRSAEVLEGREAGASAFECALQLAFELAQMKSSYRREFVKCARQYCDAGLPEPIRETVRKWGLFVG